MARMLYYSCFFYIFCIILSILISADEEENWHERKPDPHPVITYYSKILDDRCSSDEFPADSIDDEDDLDRFCTGEDRVSEEDQRNFCARLIDGPLTRLESLKVARRMVELLQRPRKTSPGCRISPALNLAAQRLIEFMTQERYSWLHDDDMPPDDQGERTIDRDYCELYSIESGRRKHSLNTMQIIMDMWNSNMTVKTITAKYKWFKAAYIKRFSQCLAMGGPMRDKLKIVDEFVKERVVDARKNLFPVHDRHLTDWGQEIASTLNITSFFKASRTWLLAFKRRHGIVSRAITEYSSRSEQEKQELIESRIRDFRLNYTRENPHYTRHMIWNADHTPFNYEVVNKRTLSWRGERDTIVNVDSKNLVSHSYTSIPIISRAGHAIGKIFLCLQEPKGSFGPTIGRRVRALEQALGNIRVFASKAGKMSTELTVKWIEEVLAPAKQETITPDDDDTEIYDYSNDTIGTLFADDFAVDPIPDRPDLLLLIDSWGGQTNATVIDSLDEINIKPMIIPKLTTKHLQPLDVIFNRQYKKFVKRVLERAQYQNLLHNITSREGIIRLHSMIWDQFTSPVYRDMLRYSWYKTDLNFVQEELRMGPPPKMVHQIQFEFDRSHKCEFNNCTHQAFIRCSHNGHYACLHHFMGGKCSRNMDRLPHYDPILSSEDS